MGMRPPADRPGALAKEAGCGIMAPIRRRRVTRSAGRRLSTGPFRPALAGSMEEDASVGLFSRIWRVIKGWLLIGVEKAEDPEIILTEAKEAMDRELAKAKEAAVTAIGQRNL